jgi:hypothetical protein
MKPIAVYVLLSAVLCSHFASAGRAVALSAVAEPGYGEKKVDVDVFVMSKCPDAVYCESHMAPLLDELKYNINLRMHYIGSKQEDGSWKCKHGDEECAGDLQQLCVQQYSKDYNRYNWLMNFILCNNKEGLDQTGSFATATKCLKETGVPFVEGTQMVACMYSPGRQAILESDFATTAALGVQTSCTVQVDGNTLCVRDGGEWKDCPVGPDLKAWKEMICASISMKSKGHLPAACKDMPSGKFAVAH